MPRFPGLAAPLFLALLAIPSCNRSDPRLQTSIDGLHWSGGSANDRRVRDLLLNALQKSTTASLAKPELVSAAFRIPPVAGKGMVEADWIGAKPDADGVRVILSGGETVDMPIGTADKNYNEKMAATVLIYQAVMPAEQDFPGPWAKMVADGAAKAVLTQGGKAVSNEVTLLVDRIVPASRPAATEAAGKMIVSVNRGKRSMYVLSRDVKAGQAFDPADAYAATLDDQTGAVGGYTDARGPAAFAGQRFAADHKQGEPLDTSMFAGAATIPAQP